MASLNALQEAQRQFELLKQRVGGGFSQLGTGVHNTAINTANNIGQSAIHFEQQHPIYGQFQAGVRNTVAPIVQNFNPQVATRYQNLNQPNTSGLAGNVAKFAGSQVPYIPLMIATEGLANPVTSRLASLVPKGTTLATRVAGSAAKGAIQFAPYGWMGGLNAAATPQERLQNIGKSVASNAALGGVLGGTGGAVGYGFEKLGQTIRSAFPKVTPEVQQSIVQQFNRDVQTGRFMPQRGAPLKKAVQDWVRMSTGKKGNEPVFHSDLLKAINNQEGKINFGAIIGSTKGKGNLLEGLQGETKSQLPTQVPGAVRAGNGSSNNSISPVPNSQDPFFNTNRLNISSGAKQKLNQVIQEVKPTIEKFTGSKLSNQKVIDNAQVSSRVLKSVVPQEQTLAWETGLLKARQKLADAASSGTVDQSYIDNLMAIKTNATDIARKLQSFSIGADPATTTAKDAIMEAVLKVEKDSTKILEAAKGVDFNDYNQAVDFYRKFIKPTKMEFIDTLRYNSMLSSPLTHINNAFSNLVNSSVVAPVEKAVAGTIDFLNPIRRAQGKPQTRFAAEAGAYAGGYAQKVGTAAHKFADVLRGKAPTGNLDVRQIPLATKGVAGKFVGKFTLPQRLLEANDQFFTELTKGGEAASLNLRKAKGGFSGNVETEALNNAKYRLFRSDLKDPRQGTLLNGIDEVTGVIQKLRASSNPIVSTIAKFTLPFVKTPMNILKQGVEYSPAGALTIPGAASKTEQLAKTIIGTSAATATALLVASGRTTWAEPTDAKKKAAFRDAGMQAYSIKIGNNWVAYDKLPPAFGFPIAFASALHDAEQNKLLNDSQVHMILSAVAKAGNFYTDQSYLKNIGDAVSSAKGDIEGMTRLISNYPQQLVPYRALLGWMARVTDPYQRKVNQDASFWDKQVQQLFTQIPFLSQTVPARLNGFGEPISNRNRLQNAVSPIKISPENPQKKEYYDLLQQKTQNTRNVNQIESLLEQHKKPNMNFSEQAQAAELQTTNPQDTMQQRLLDDVAKKQVKLTGETIEQNGKIYYQIGSSTKVIDTSEKVQEPQFTGQTEIDKKAISEYNSLITKKSNEIHDLISIGKLTQTQGEQLLEGLQQRKSAFKASQTQKLTGNATIDKYVYAKQSTALTTQINDIVAKVQAGELSTQQGEQQIQALKQQQQALKLRTAKPRKPKAPKRIPVAKIRARTSSSSGPKITAPKIRLPKVRKIKVARGRKR